MQNQIIQTPEYKYNPKKDTAALQMRRCVLNAHEYLSQAYRIDQRINSKIEQVTCLSAMSNKATVTLTGMPKNPNRATSAMADTIAAIVDLQTEINSDIEKLLKLKREIMCVIDAVDDLEYRTLLELRYLCFKTWEHIAMEMNFSVRRIYVIHKMAVKKVVVPKTLH